MIPIDAGDNNGAVAGPCASARTGGASLVCLVYLVSLVSLVSLNKKHKINQTNNNPPNLAVLQLTVRDAHAIFIVLLILIRFDSSHAS